jgi:hypothetical protein
MLSMRQRTRNLIITFVFCAISIPSLIHAQAFEGTITMEMSSPMLGNQQIEMMYSLKGDKVLQSADDPKAGKVSVYTDIKTGTQIIVQEAQKQGMQIDQATIDIVVKKMNLPSFEPKKTDKKEKIAGYNCELYTMMVDTAQKQEMDMWLTKDFPKDISAAIRNCIDAGMKTTGVKSETFMTLFKSGYAPVRIEMKQAGITQFTNEFAKAEPKKLSDAIFVVPTDIKITVLDPNTLGGAPPAK